MSVHRTATYYAGVGTTDSNGGLLSVLAGKAFGAGAEQIRETAYTDLVQSYRPGDKLFITGFSRGASA